MTLTRTIGALALLLAAVSPGTAETLRIGMVGDPATLDPAQSTSVTDRVALAAACDKLIDLDEKLAYVPQLDNVASIVDSVTESLAAYPGARVKEVRIRIGVLASVVEEPSVQPRLVFP